MEAFLGAEQFARVYALLQTERKIHTRQREQVRLFLEAVYWIGRSGAQWRLLPRVYGAWNSVYKRCARWDDLGVWARLFAGVADEPDLQRVLIAATVIRAHACAAGAPKKRVARRRKHEGARAAGAARSCMCWSTPWATH